MLLCDYGGWDYCLSYLGSRFRPILLTERALIGWDKLTLMERLIGSLSIIVWLQSSVMGLILRSVFESGLRIGVMICTTMPSKNAIKFILMQRDEGIELYNGRKIKKHLKVRRKLCLILAIDLWSFAKISPNGSKLIHTKLSIRSGA